MNKSIILVIAVICVLAACADAHKKSKKGSSKLLVSRLGGKCGTYGKKEYVCQSHLVCVTKGSNSHSHSNSKSNSKKSHSKSKKSEKGRCQVRATHSTTRMPTRWTTPVSFPWYRPSTTSRLPTVRQVGENRLCGVWKRRNQIRTCRGEDFYCKKRSKNKLRGRCTRREISSTVFPATTTFIPTRWSTFRPVEETTFRPVEETTFRPVEETTFRPVEETTFRPVEETTFRPVEETTFRPAEETTFRPVPTTVAAITPEPMNWCDFLIPVLNIAPPCPKGTKCVEMPAIGSYECQADQNAVDTSAPVATTAAFAPVI